MNWYYNCLWIVWLCAIWPKSTATRLDRFFSIKIWLFFEEIHRGSAVVASWAKLFGSEWFIEVPLLCPASKNLSLTKSTPKGLISSTKNLFWAYNSKSFLSSQAVCMSTLLYLQRSMTITFFVVVTVFYTTSGNSNPMFKRQGILKSQ